MSLRQTYERFLSSPSAEALASDASITYLPTLTTINESAAILKHLVAQQKQFTKKGEKILSVVDGRDGLCLDVDTTIEFVTGGGTILPGLDDNFLADRVVSFPVIHIVKFDDEQKIKQIRQYWDQGSLLKQVDVIGSRGRNWPIRDGKDQTRLIASLASATASSVLPNSRPPTSSSEAQDAPGRSRAQSGKSATGDPHATLSLFQPRDVNEQPETPYTNKVISPRASARPAPRDYAELFAGEDAEGSPSKREVQAKSGAGKNYKPIRLFDQGEEEVTTRSPEKLKTHSKKYKHFEFDDGEGGDRPEATNDTTEYFDFSKDHKSGKVKTNPKKYDHFELGNGDGDGVKPKANQQEGAKGQPHWSFEDFSSPQQVKGKMQPHNMKQFGWSDDEDKSPVRRPIVHHARPDAVSHFEIRDDSTPGSTDRKQPFRGRSHNKGLGLYDDPILGEDGDSTSAKDKENQQQGDETRRAADFRKTFGSQFEMTDASPSSKEKVEKLRPNQKKILKGLDASWDMYEDRPDQDGGQGDPQKGSRQSAKVAAGEGGQRQGEQRNGKMAARIRKDTQPSWGFGGDDQD